MNSLLDIWHELWNLDNNRKRLRQFVELSHLQVCYPQVYKNMPFRWNIDSTYIKDNFRVTEEHIVKFSQFISRCEIKILFNLFPIPNHKWSLKLLDLAPIQIFSQALVWTFQIWVKLILSVTESVLYLYVMCFRLTTWEEVQSVFNKSNNILFQLIFPPPTCLSLRFIFNQNLFNLITGLTELYFGPKSSWIWMNFVGLKSKLSHNNRILLTQLRQYVN